MIKILTHRCRTRCDQGANKGQPGEANQENLSTPVVGCLTDRDGQSDHRQEDRRDHPTGFIGTANDLGNGRGILCR